MKRGVKVTYFTTEDFRRIVEPTGAKFVPAPSWMAANAPQNENKEGGDDDGGVAAVVPFLFLNEAGAYIDTVPETLREDRPDAILHDFAGIAGTMAADVLKVPNIMLYTSYPSNDTYSVAEGFSHVRPDHPLRIAADRIAYAWAYPERFAAVYSMSCVPQDMRPAAAELMSGEPAPNPWAALDRERNRHRLENAGGLEAYLASPQNTWDIAKQIAKRDDMPKMYFSCGTADFVMYRHFQAFRKYAEEIGLKAEFTETEGYNHEWRFWEKEIQRAIGIFLPGDEKAGNVF